MELDIKQIVAERMKFFGDNPLHAALLKLQVRVGGRRPEPGEEGEARECFCNALQLALRKLGWKYAEGLALSGELIKMGVVMPMDHAWCVDGDGIVVDPTWTDPAGSHYLGAEIEPSLAWKAALKKKTYGVLTGNFGEPLIKNIGKFVGA